MQLVELSIKGGKEARFRVQEVKKVLDSLTTMSKYEHLRIWLPLTERMAIM